MHHFWIVNETDDGKRVFIQEAGDILNARLKASVAGFEGRFVEAHQLQAKMVKAIPAKMLGRVLTQDEAARLLKKF
jgi:hypothetical protein